MNRTTIARAIATALLGSAVLVTSVPALSQHHGEGHRGARMSQMTDADRAQLRERMQARMSQRLDRLASRLEVKASQQGGWEAYRGVWGPFAGFPDDAKVENGWIRLPERPGIGFEGQNALYAVMRELAP